MANDIDKTSSHYKGEFSDIYEVNQKYPNGGADGDYVEIDGWAHYWNADRGTWCVNARRDEYWDEKIATFDDVLKLKADKTELDDAVKAQGVKDAAQDAEISKKANKTEFDDAVKAQGVKDAAQDAEISKKANKTEFDDAVKAQGVKDAAQDAEISKKANSSDVNAELQKKFNKSDIAQEAGSATDKVMSQKAVSDLLNGKHILLSEDEYNALEVKDSSKIYMIYEE